MKVAETRAEFQALAQHRVLDSVKACGADRWHAGLYLGGYAIECAIKADLCGSVLGGGRWSRGALEAAGSGGLWTHNLLALAERAGYPPDILDDIRRLSRMWSEQLRYHLPLMDRNVVEPVHTLIVSVYLRLKQRAL